LLVSVQSILKISLWTFAFYYALTSSELKRFTANDNF